MLNDNKNNQYKIHLSEVLYYLMLLCFMGAKAIGLSEGQWPFYCALICGSFIFIGKLIITKYSLFEWLLNCLFILVGIIVLCRNGHIEILFSSLLIIGIKNVSIKRVIGVSSLIWGTLFCVTIIRALAGFYPGVISTQKKVGMDYGIVRYSLGFTHPNVLHITFFVISLMILYLVKKEKKKIISVSFFIFLGNMYIFSYSMSYTGFLVVIIGIIINLYLTFKKKISLADKVIFVVLVASCFMIPVIGQRVLPVELSNIINNLINYRLKLAGDTFSKFAPSLFGNSENLYLYGLNLDSSFAYILFYHGIIVFLLYVIAYLGVLIKALKNKDASTVALLSSMAISGVTEQYLGNLSFKNMSIFFIGDLVYNTKPIEDTSSEINIDKLRSLKYRIKNYFSGTPYLKCILPALFISLISLLIFNLIWTEPKNIYYVDAPNPMTLVFRYDESMREELEIDDSIVVGNIYDGCNLNREGWVDFRLETVRGRLSTIIWSFIIGFVISAYILNIKKYKSVYIEDAIQESDSILPNVPKCNILGTHIAVTNMDNTVSYIENNLSLLKGKYICVSNVHTTVMSYLDKEYNDVQNGAVMALPDGKPLSYVSRRRGYIQADRVAGPDLMTEIFKISVKKGYKHYFFGSTEETLNKLKNNLEKLYPGINIVGMCSPKYYKTVDEIPEDENSEHIRLINETAPDFVWIGLGAPKQEIWMARHENEINGVMIGVGAGFDFHAGTIKRAPKLVQALYLEWLFRLLQDPKRLVKRYLSTNARFIKETFKEGKRLKHQLVVSDKKRLLIYAHYYSPDVASTGQILTELAEGMLDTFDVTVIAVVPSYKGTIDEKYRAYRYYQQDVRGVKVYRVRVPEFTKTKKLSRGINILAYFFRARSITKKVGPQDYVFAVSQPPILGGLLGTYGKRKKNAKFIYNIQDFNPEQIKSVGYSKGKTILNFMMLLDKHSCRKADLIVTVGKDLGETIEHRFERKKVPNYTIINNWINEEEVYPLHNSQKVYEFRKKYGLLDKFVFMYSGNIGLYYDLENLLKVFEKLPKDLKTPDGREVVFALVGDGGIKGNLVEYANEHSLTNVVFIPYQEKSQLVYSLNAGDVHICANAKGIRGVSCPSKYYGIAAVGKPVLAILEEDTEIRNLIEKTRSGLVYAPGNYDEIYSGIMEMVSKEATDELNQMGTRGRDFLISNLTKDISIEKYKEAIKSL